MKKKWMIRGVALVLCLLLVGGCWFGYRYATDPDRLDYSYNENPYPPLSNPPLASILSVENLSDAVAHATEAVVARAVTDTEVVSFSVEAEEDEAMKAMIEKTGGTYSTTLNTIREVTQMEVLRSFGGTLQAGDTFDFEVAEGFIGSYPVMKMGDTYLLFLVESTISENGYTGAGYHQGLFYVTEDDTVYPAWMGDAFKKYNGMPVDEFARVIDKHW